MSDNKSIALPMFDGKDEHYQEWWTKFRAFATAKGFVNALKGREADLPATEDEATTNESKIKAKLRNSLAMAYLVNSFKSSADLSLAYETMSDEWPGGLAFEVMEKLKEVYQPKDSVTEIELHDLLMDVKMKKKEDPKTLFEQIASIENWYNEGTQKVPKSQLIAVVLRAAPVEYASVLTSEQQKQGTSLNLSHLRAAMNKYYCQVYKKKGNNKNNDDDEMALTNTNNGGKNNKNNKNHRRKKFNGNCNLCGKANHMAKDCWDNPKNADSRPSWYKPKTKNEHGEIAATTSNNNNNQRSVELQLINLDWDTCMETSKDCEEESIEETMPKDLMPKDYEESAKDEKVKNDETELQLVNLSWGKYAEAFAEDDDDVDYDDEMKNIQEEMKNIQEDNEETTKETTNTETMLRMSTSHSQSILEDPEIWVCDTGATTNSTGKEDGMINKSDTSDSKTRVGNGATIATQKIGEIPFMATNNNEKGNMSDVHLMSGAPFNLISGTKLLNLGYEISGNKNSGIIFTHETTGKQLIFNIKIETPSGMLLATHLKRTATEVGGATTTDTSSQKTKTLSITEAHQQLGHINEAETRKTAKTLGWTITRGSLGVCEECGIAKAKQKNVKIEVPKKKSTEVNGRIYLDLSRIVHPSSNVKPKRPNWCMIVDEKTGYKSASFHETKDGMVEPVCSKLFSWAANNMVVQII